MKTFQKYYLIFKFLQFYKDAHRLELDTGKFCVAILLFINVGTSGKKETATFKAIPQT